MASCSIILAWKIPWTEEHPWGHKELDMTECMLLQHPKVSKVLGRTPGLTLLLRGCFYFYFLFIYLFFLWLFLAVQCPALKSPEQGSMSCFHSAKAFQHQSSCSFSCEEGFTLVGPEVVHCTALGVWTAPTPVCKGEFQEVGYV